MKEYIVFEKNLKLSKLSQIAEDFFQMSECEIDYQNICNVFSNLVNAKYCIFNLYDKKGGSFTSVAISGSIKGVLAAGKVFGFDLINRKWPRDLEREELIKLNTITQCSILDLVGTQLPKSKVDLLVNLFGLGKSIIIKISKNDELLGDFMVIMDKNVEFESHDEATLYTRLLGMLIVQKRTKRQLELSESKFADIIEFLPDATFAIDLNHEVIIWNKAIEVMTGVLSEDIIGKTDYSYSIPFYGEARPLLIDLVDNSNIELEKTYTDFKRKENYVSARTFANNLNSAKGSWVFAKASPLHDNLGNIVGYIQIIQDITERKKIEEKLIEGEQTYKALFEFSGVGIAYYNPEGFVISFNAKAAQNMGGVIEDFAGKNIYDFCPKENADVYMSRITAASLSEVSQEYEDLISLPTGNLWFFSTFSRVHDTAGKVVGIQIISQNITDLKNKEEKIAYLSYHDQLTGLYNRRFFDEELLRLDTSRNLPLTLAIGDVNGLKLVNDSFGHKTGDQLLICVADVLRKACRQDDIIARVGGDEFSIIFPKTDEADADMIIQRINRLISLEKIGPLEFSIAFSYGTKTADESIESIIKKAEDHMYRNKLNDSSSLRNGTIKIIMNTLFEKNSRELKHSERVSSLCVDIATALGFEKNEINHIRSAGLMHDIGKIGIDEHVLNSDAKLTEVEWIEVKKHAEIGYRILSSATDFSDIAEDVFSHHERWDGNGYPRGINSESISIYARIITIADAFDAMISERPYRTGDKALRIEDAINEIKKNAGTQFDPEIAKIFVEKVLNVAW